MSYNRITKEKITKDNVILHRNIYGDIVISQEVWDVFEKEHNQLCELEDKIENGTLVELPCKVGDRLFCLVRIQDKLTVRQYQATSICFGFNGFEINLLWYGYADKDDIGKRVFLTKAEAEKKLKELQKDDV